jgi:hypothetical protein
MSSRSVAERKRFREASSGDSDGEYGIPNTERKKKMTDTTHLPAPKSDALPRPTGTKFEKHLLKPDDLGDGKQPVKIVTAPRAADPEFSAFNDLQMDVEFEGMTYIFPMHSSKQNYLMLFERFGSDPKAWVGKTFRLRSQYSRNYETDFLQVAREKGDK